MDDMEEKAPLSERVLAGVCLGVLFVFLALVGGRIVTRILWPDAGEETFQFVPIGWAAAYPFSEEDAAPPSASPGLASRLTSAVMTAEEGVEYYTTDALPGYRRLTEAARLYERAIGWNYTAYDEYNGVVMAEEGYLTGLTALLPVEEQARSVAELAAFCRERGVAFLYVHDLSKLSAQTDPLLAGSLDFSNENTDAFLALLTAEGVEFYDHREDVRAEGLPLHELFYRTDHHWRPETGLWAARRLLTLLRDEYGLAADPDVLDPAGFTTELYPDWFLGSEGKKATLARVDPEDFTLLYPAFETSITYNIPNLALYEVGDFSVTYDMSRVETLDYYGLNPYAAYDHGDRPLIRFENVLAEGETRVLMIHNSFANCELPFLALGVRYVDSIDPRHFTGSIRSFIERTQPDIVIVAYPYEGGDIDFSSHSDPFDFR